MSGGSGGGGGSKRSGGGMGKTTGDFQIGFDVDKLSNREIDDLRSKLPYTSKTEFSPSRGVKLIVDYESPKTRRAMSPERRTAALEKMRKADALLSGFQVIGK